MDGPATTATPAPSDLQLVDVTILWEHPVFQYCADWINEAMTNVIHTECYLGMEFLARPDHFEYTAVYTFRIVF